MPVLLAGRTVQGLGGGALVALVYIAQDRFFPNRLVPRIIACLSVVWMASALCGPLVGGAFATAGLWRYAFWSFAVQGLLLAAVVRPLLARAGAGAARQRDCVALRQPDWCRFGFLTACRHRRRGLLRTRLLAIVSIILE